MLHRHWTNSSTTDDNLVLPASAIEKETTLVLDTMQALDEASKKEFEQTVDQMNACLNPSELARSIAMAYEIEVEMLCTVSAQSFAADGPLCFGATQSFKTSPPATPATTQLAELDEPLVELDLAAPASGAQTQRSSNGVYPGTAAQHQAAVRNLRQTHRLKTLGHSVDSMQTAALALYTRTGANEMDLEDQMSTRGQTLGNPRKPADPEPTRNAPAKLVGVPALGKPAIVHPETDPMQVHHYLPKPPSRSNQRVEPATGRNLAQYRLSAT